ncbi:ATPase [Novipirellula artificiosorum]|uniref:ATPase n=1 Tax=Novipirellula artificiosorum TaxID=2528016 RepID=UPI001E49C79B|nr:ATPase [Novipirellula artificiosorum]
MSCAILTQNHSPICLEVDIDPSIRIPADGEKVAELVRTLVNQSIAEMGVQGGELTITAVDVSSGLELEVADTGRSIEQRATSLPFIAAALGAKIHWQNCPQGGAAATIVFRPTAGASRMVA